MSKMPSSRGVSNIEVWEAPNCFVTTCAALSAVSRTEPTSSDCAVTSADNTSSR